MFLCNCACIFIKEKMHNQLTLHNSIWQFIETKLISLKEIMLHTCQKNSFLTIHNAHTKLTSFRSK